jgi:hypothetical protein
MTHLTTTLADRWPRCPRCGVLAVASWPWHHRPGCPAEDTDPDEWETHP